MSNKKINATKGRENIAGERYREIRDLINENSAHPFKDIIGEIAGISPGSYYNYTSKKSDKYGKVSLYTVKNLSSFFELPQGIFDCTLDFDENAKERICQVIKDKFGDYNQANLVQKKNVTEDLITQTKNLSKKLTNEDDLDTLKKSLAILESTINIIKNKIQISKL
ncbi:hypothetical protein [Fuchsiella alkaliacetigena]|uniref:hypothetical protein n=1 Tax=Fuchsiella alkaliacetigena TaxID=957042 RepID=UPI00200B4BAB|nr:hypothetical protein [Fuchsiella alkaliacetigena]MCK8825910.1 hypothetical protein [Fuchsiella alkaliacetigena]